MSGYRDRLGNHQDHARIAAALEESSGIYSGMSSLEKQIARAFDEARTGKVWKTRFYKYATNNTSAGTKMLDNAGMEIPTPATDSVEGSDPYLEYGVFRWQRCNYVRDDSDGFARPTALKGWPGYKEEGAVDVGTLKMTFYWKYEEGATYYDIIMSDTPHPEIGLVPWCDAVKIDADGNKTVMPYFIVSAFNSVTASDGLLRSQPGPSAYNQSYNSQITDYQKKGAGYWGSRASRNTLQIIWLAIKYATKNSQKYFSGCTTFDARGTVTVAETDASRIVITKSTAFERYHTVSVSKSGAASNIDRQSADAYATANRVLITSVEDVTISGTTYTALNIDGTVTTAVGEIVTSYPCHSGITDKVIGLYDGAPVSYTNGKHGYRIGGVEYMNGQAVIAADVVMDYSAHYVRGWYVAERPTKHVANAYTGYKKIGGNYRVGAYQGDIALDMSTGAYRALNPGDGDSVGVGDYIWDGGDGTSLREYYQGGYLGGGSGAGACYVYCWCELGDSGWYYASCD